MNKKNIIDLAISIVLPVLADPITGEEKSRKEKSPRFAGEGVEQSRSLSDSVYSIH